jgi:hypothetical protein
MGFSCMIDNGVVTAQRRQIRTHPDYDWGLGQDCLTAHPLIFFFAFSSYIFINIVNIWFLLHMHKTFQTL